MTNYGKARYFRVDDVNFENPESKCIPGTTTNLKDFYHQRYNIAIRNPKQPLLVVNNKSKPDPDLMIPELCLMTGLPDDFD